jgi:hypothetical protein
MKEKSAREQLNEQLAAYGWTDLGGGYWTHPGYEGGNRRADIHQAAAATIHQLRLELGIGGPADAFDERAQARAIKPKAERSEPPTERALVDVVARVVGELLELAMQPEGRLGVLVTTVASHQVRLEAETQNIADHEKALGVLCKLALSNAGVTERPTVADLDALERIVRGGL